ncbi:MAG: hypothetical protein ACREJ5_12415 [Geminicoccaceae bacterium]
MTRTKNKMLEEAINVILEIWQRDPPYEIDLPGNRYKVSTAQHSQLELGVGYLGKPLQKPHPEIVATVVAPFSKGVIAMGRRDFHPLSANFLLSRWLPSHWQNYTEGKLQAGLTPDRAPWRIAYRLRRRRRQDRCSLRSLRRGQPLPLLLPATVPEADPKVVAGAASRCDLTHHLILQPAAR